MNIWLKIVDMGSNPYRKNEAGSTIPDFLTVSTTLLIISSSLSGEISKVGNSYPRNLFSLSIHECFLSSLKAVSLRGT
jgi:hypothetical protein